MTRIAITADNALAEGTPVFIVAGSLRDKVGRISPLPSAPGTYAVFVCSMLYTARDIPADHICPLEAWNL